MIVQICVGSSCHLKGSERLVALFQQAVAEHGLEDVLTLAGSFCTGRCNREGVTVTVDDAIFTGVTPENFSSFFNNQVLKQAQAERNS